MALWACLGCGCRYAVGLSGCPQCGSPDYEEDGMPKITTWGGASYGHELPPAAGDTSPAPGATGAGADQAVTGAAEPDAGPDGSAPAAAGTLAAEPPAPDAPETPPETPPAPGEPPGD